MATSGDVAEQAVGWGWEYEIVGWERSGAVLSSLNFIICWPHRHYCGGKRAGSSGKSRHATARTPSSLYDSLEDIRYGVFGNHPITDKIRLAVNRLYYIIAPEGR